jgi:hypothetical protein
LVAAKQSSLKLLIASQPGEINRSACVHREWYRSSYETAVIPPVEADPGSAFAPLILDVRCLIKLLVVVDPEDASVLSYRDTETTGLRREEARRHAGENYQRAKAVKFRNAHAAHVSGYF